MQELFVPSFAYIAVCKFVTMWIMFEDEHFLFITDNLMTNLCSCKSSAFSV